MPVNLRYPLAMLAQACEEYLAATRRRLSLEWAMIESVNDSDRGRRGARRLCAPAARPRQPDPAQPHRRLRHAGIDTHARVASFRGLLDAEGVNVTVRRNRGLSIDAACGQLAAPVGARMGS